MRDRQVNVYSRSEVVKGYVSGRANGKCEGCGLQHPPLPLKEDLYPEATSSFDYAWAYNGRGTSYNFLGGFQNSIADFTQAIQLALDLAWAYNNRALAYFYLGQYTNQEADETKACSFGRALWSSRNLS